MKTWLKKYGLAFLPLVVMLTYYGGSKQAIELDGIRMNVTATSHEVSFTWTFQDLNISDEQLTGKTALIQRSSDGGRTWETIATCHASDCHYTMNGFTVDRTWTYRVCVEDVSINIDELE